MTVSADIKYVGVNDHEIDLFEGQYVVPNGMAYNSYVIVDEKIVVMDTVDKHFTQEWLGNVAKVLGTRSSATANRTTSSSSTWNATTPVPSWRS